MDKIPENIKLLEEIFADTMHEEWLAGQEIKKKKAAEDQQLVSDYARTFSAGDYSLRVLGDILLRGHVLEDIFHPSSRMPFLAGERNLALYIYHMFKRSDYLKRVK